MLDVVAFFSMAASLLSGGDIHTILVATKACHFETTPLICLDCLLWSALERTTILILVQLLPRTP